MTDLVAYYFILSNLKCQRYFLITYWILTIFLFKIFYLTTNTDLCNSVFNNLIRLINFLTYCLNLAFLYIILNLFATWIRCLFFYLVSSSRWLSADSLMRIFFDPNNISLSYNYFFAILYTIFMHCYLKSSSVWPWMSFW